MNVCSNCGRQTCPATGWVGPDGLSAFPEALNDRLDCERAKSKMLAEVLQSARAETERERERLAGETYRRACHEAERARDELRSAYNDTLAGYSVLVEAIGEECDAAGIARTAPTPMVRALGVALGEARKGLEEVLDTLLALRANVAVWLVHFAGCATCRMTRTGDATMNVEACADGARLLAEYNATRTRASELRAAHPRQRGDAAAAPAVPEET